MHNWDNPYTLELSEEYHLENSTLFNEKNAYHNINHVRQLFEYAKDHGVPYSHELALAIQYHDYVYDENPEKEKRSAEAFVQAMRFSSNSGLAFDTDVVVDAIMATNSHKIVPTPKTFPLNSYSFEDRVINDMIALDLCAFLEPRTIAMNTDLLLEESMNLYGVTAKEFLTNHLNFLRNFHVTISQNEENALFADSSVFGPHGFTSEFWSITRENIHQETLMVEGDIKKWIDQLS